MTQPYNPALHRFALFVASCTLLLLVAGALVTSNDAALSVPDWPLSYGTVTPPMVGGIIYEHSHRVIAATVNSPWAELFMPPPGGPREICQRYEQDCQITRGPEGIYTQPSEKPGFGWDFIVG